MKYSNDIDINKLAIKRIITISRQNIEVNNWYPYSNNTKVKVSRISQHRDSTGRIDRYILLSDNNELIGSIESTAVVFVEYMEDK